MKNTVIFDLDGTLLYTLEDLTDSVNYALRQAGYPEHTEQEVRGYVGNGIRKLIMRAVPEGITPKETEEVYEIFCKYYGANCNKKTRPYEGIMELLKELKERGIKTAIVSNKMDSAVQALREEYFGEFIDAAAGVLSDGRTKPDPESTLRVLKELNSSKDEAVYVGDSEVDIQTGKNAGVKVVSVTWGFKTKEFLEQNGAEVMIDTPEELLSRL